MPIKKLIETCRTSFPENWAWRAGIEVHGGGYEKEVSLTWWASVGGRILRAQTSGELLRLLPEAISDEREFQRKAKEEEMLWLTP